MPGVDINEYIPSPDHSPDSKGFQFGMGSPDTYQSPSNKDGVNYSDIQIGNKKNQAPSLLNLKPVPSDGMSDNRAKLGFMSPSGRIVKIEHYKREAMLSNSQSPKPTRSPALHQLPAEILKKYNSHYLSMSNPHPPAELLVATYTTSDVDECIHTPPAIRSQQYRVDYSSMLSTAVKYETKHL